MCWCSREAGRQRDNPRASGTATIIRAVLLAAALAPAAHGQVFTFRASDAAGWVHQGIDRPNVRDGVRFEVTINVPYDLRGAREAHLQMTGFDVDAGDKVRIRVNDAPQLFRPRSSRNNAIKISKIPIPLPLLRNGRNVFHLFPETKSHTHAHGAQFTNFRLLVDYVRLRSVEGAAPPEPDARVQVYWGPDDLVGMLMGERMKVSGRIDIPHDPAAATSAVLRMQTYDMERSEHHEVRINGTVLSMDKAIAAGGGGDQYVVLAKQGNPFATLEMPVPVSALKRGANPIEFTNVPQGSAGSQFGNVRLILTYPSPPEDATSRKRPKRRHRSARTRTPPNSRRSGPRAQGAVAAAAADPVRKLFKEAEQLFVMRQYEMARARFAHLLATYPESRYIAEAREYLKRMAP